MIIDTHNDKICLIDFLDSFVETPFFDILKLRQDTSFLWTISMHGRIQNLTKIELIYILIPMVLIETTHTLSLRVSVNLIS